MQASAVPSEELAERQCSLRGSAHPADAKARQTKVQQMKERQ